MMSPSFSTCPTIQIRLLGRKWIAYTHIRVSILANPLMLLSLPKSLRCLRSLTRWIVPVLLLASAQGQLVDDEESDLSLEELVNTPAVLSSRLESQVFNAPNGSFVFTDEDIENLPVDSIPELLRYAPGVHIIRPSNGIWGLGIRGINSRFFNRVLFTVDEQNVYGSIFSGLFGSQHDLLMEDVSSVEVAYGPGGGTWDNNAVNGRVNVLLKTAFETEGNLLRINIGSENRGVAGRVGWAVNEDTSARVSLKAGMRDSSFTRFPYENDWDTARAGFRVDHRASSRDLLSVTGEAYYSDLGYAYNLANFDDGSLTFQADSERLSGANAQLKWTRNSSNDSSYSVRNWISYSDLEAPYADFSTLTTGIEARGEVRLNDHHAFSYNIGAAYDQEKTASTLASDFTSETLRSFVAYTGFQEEWSILPETLELSWGVDFRYIDRPDDTQVSPNIGLVYSPSEKTRLWLSYSSANRTPPVSLSVIESLRSGKALDTPILITGPDGVITIEHSLTDAVSNIPLQAEELDAIEAGFRTVFADDKGSLSINAYSYRYDKIIARIGISATPVIDTETPYLDILGGYENLLEGDAYGFEASFEWKLNEAHQFRLNYSHQQDSFESLIEPTSSFAADLIQFSIDEFDNSTPEHMASLYHSFLFNEDWRLDSGLRYESGYDFAKGYQPSIFQLDSRLTWQISESLKLSLVGRNLLDSTVQEARLKDVFGHWTEMKREAYLEISAQF